MRSILLQVGSPSFRVGSANRYVAAVSCGVASSTSQESSRRPASVLFVQWSRLIGLPPRLIKRVESPRRRVESSLRPVDPSRRPMDSSRRPVDSSRCSSKSPRLSVRSIAALLTRLVVASSPERGPLIAADVLPFRVVISPIRRLNAGNTPPRARVTFR